MKIGRVIGAVLLIAIAGSAVWWGGRIRDGNAVPPLTADIRRRLNLPPRDDHFPQGSLAEALDGITRPDSVAHRLAPLAPLVKSAHWVQGQGHQFVAQILELQLTTGGVFEVALVYDTTSERLIDIDTPEYLGETDPVQSQSEIAKYPSPGAI
jgi:hypothetical protein